jgi:hypothetical protein
MAVSGEGGRVIQLGRAPWIHHSVSNKVVTSTRERLEGRRRSSPQEEGKPDFSFIVGPLYTRTNGR